LRAALRASPKPGVDHAALDESPPEACTAVRRRAAPDTRPAKDTR
jgi:hypothetical protein